MKNNKKGGTTSNSTAKNKTNISSGNHTVLTGWDAIEAYRDTLQENGLGRPEIKTGFQRIKVEGDKGSQKSGWSIYHPDGNIPAGAFGNWRTGLNKTFCFKKDNKPLTSAERKELALIYADTKKKRKAEQERKYAKARRLSHAGWNKGVPAKPDHPYLVKKLCQGAAKYLRQDAKKGNLLVPLYNQKRLVSLQYINKNGGKFFVKGSELKGSYFVFGDLKKPFDMIMIVEGISTGFTVYSLADQAPTFCAMNAGNLKAVALSVRKAFPDSKIIVAGDNDQRTDGSINIGEVKSKEAAQAVDGYYSIPQFPDPEQKGDWNDLFVSIQSKGANHG